MHNDDTLYIIIGLVWCALGAWKLGELIVAFCRGVRALCRWIGRALGATGRGIGRVWLAIWRAFRALCVRCARVWDARNNRMMRNQADSVKELLDQIGAMKPDDPRLPGMTSALMDLARAHAAAIEGNSPIPDKHLATAQKWWSSYNVSSTKAS